MAFIGLVRAGRRPPDRRAAYRPPPLVKSTAPSGRECREPGGSGAKKRRDDDHQDQGSAGNDGGRSWQGRRQVPRPAGREPYGRGEPTPGSRPRTPQPLVARRYAPTGTARKSAVAGDAVQPACSSGLLKRVWEGLGRASGGVGQCAQVDDALYESKMKYETNGSYPDSAVPMLAPRRARKASRNEGYRKLSSASFRGSPSNC